MVEHRRNVSAVLHHDPETVVDRMGMAYAKVLLSPEERQRLYIEFVPDDLLTVDFEKKLRHSVNIAQWV